MDTENRSVVARGMMGGVESCYIHTKLYIGESRYLSQVLKLNIIYKINQTLFFIVFPCTFWWGWKEKMEEF